MKMRRFWDRVSKEALRSMIPWVKRNPMPESVTDRPTTAIEYVFLFTKSSCYFYDNEAIKKDATEAKVCGQNSRMFQDRDPNHPAERKIRPVYGPPEGATPNGKNQTGRCNGGKDVPCSGKRSRRNSDWFFESWQGLYSEDDEPLAFVVNPAGFKEAHFATFPEKLVEPMILAGCPKEVCPKCGKARERIIDIKTNTKQRNAAGKHEGEYQRGRVTSRNAVEGDFHDLGSVSRNTIGWSDCGCGVDFIPGLVLDPFMGSGTVGYVAAINQRDYLGIELNPKYIEMAKRRIAEAETGVSQKEIKNGQKALF